MKKFVCAFLTLSAFALSTVAFPSIRLISGNAGLTDLSKSPGFDRRSDVSRSDTRTRRDGRGKYRVTSPAAAFTPGNLVIYRVGTGAAALNSNATAVFLDEYTPSGTLVQSIPMPTSASGSNRQLTASGTATSEGLLTRSVDGRYLLVPGYDAAPGTGSIATSTSATVNRVVGRIDAAGVADTSTALTDAINGGNPRSAASTDGTDIWLSGNGPTSPTGGIRYATLGATTSTLVSPTPINFRAISIFDGQLYSSHLSGAFRLATVGTGTPTTSGNTTSNLPGYPTATTSPYQFFFADLDAVVPGVDTVYVADDSSLAGGGGAQKYSLVGGNWTFNGTIGLATTRGLTATVSGTIVTLYVTNGTTFQTATDTSGYNAAPNGTFASLAPAGTNTAFRGIALAPFDTTPPTVTSIDDADADDSVSVGATLTYTIAFGEDIDSSSVDATDFDNAGTASVTIGTIIETSPGVFTVQVTPTTSGTLILRIPSGAVIEDTSGNDLAVPIQDDTTVTVLVPTAAPAIMSGRVTTSDGTGIRGAIVSVQGGDGVVRHAATGTFGYFRFPGLESGATYVVTVSAKRYRFAEPSRVVHLTENVAGVDFTASR